MSECINHSKIRLFADDSIVYRFIHDQQDAKLQEDVNAIQTWISIWQMNFNISKCCSIQITHDTMHMMENTYYLYNTLLATLKILVSLCSPTLVWQPCSGYNSQRKLHPRITIKICQNLYTWIDRTWIERFSLTPARILLYCMVPFTKIPCRYYWESPVSFYSLWLPFWL